MKIEVDTIHKHNQKTIPVVWSSVFLTPYTLCVSVCEAFMLMELYGCSRSAPK